MINILYLKINSMDYVYKICKSTLDFSELVYTGLTIY
jgi:hypothetical protein